jgi:CheY-like chemotaxis protein
VRPAAAPASRDVSISPDELAGERPASEPGPLVLIAMPDESLANATAAALEAEGFTVHRVADGVEAMLEVQRKLPRALVLAAELPKMFGFQVCEVVKRNESLRGTWVVLVGAIHHRERYRREPDELYGADAYVEGHELPAGLFPVLGQGGVAAPGTSRSESRPTEAPARTVSPPMPAAPLVDVPQPNPAAAQSPAPPTEVTDDDGLAGERQKAERLARIVVSDIVLYNEERFAAAVRSGNVLDAMSSDLSEGRGLFEERIDARVRGERDYLKDELLRRAADRGAA